MLAQVLIVAMMFTPLLTVGLQSPATAQDSTAAKSPFSKLKVKPGALHFKKLNLSTTPSESLSFTVSNTGTGTTLNVTVGAASAPFSVTSGGGAAALAPGAVATVTVQFAPAVSQKKAYKGTLSVTSDATKGKSSKTVKLSGKATGVLPSPTPTATPTPAAPSAGAPVGAMALAVTGAFAPPAVAVSTPASFPTPSGGITAKASPRGDSASQDSASSSAPAINPATPAGIISAYAPLGSWDEPATGVALISIAGGGASGKISTPMTVNSCASVPSGTFVAASTSPEAVCVSNGTDVYLIDGTTLVKTLTSGGGANSISFSGGSCTTCGVVVDSISGNAMISVATADGKGGYQILNLAAQTFSSVIP
ncbi:MAG: hypothetical protein ACREQT_14040, partial [Candidatus Binataceae bacterium]